MYWSHWPANRLTCSVGIWVIRTLSTGHSRASNIIQSWQSHGSKCNLLKWPPMWQRHLQICISSELDSSPLRRPLLTAGPNNHEACGQRGSRRTSSQCLSELMWRWNPVRKKQAARGPAQMCTLSYGRHLALQHGGHAVMICHSLDEPHVPSNLDCGLCMAYFKCVAEWPIYCRLYSFCTFYSS